MTTTPILDHTAYPPIIDAILSHSSPDTLLAFTSTGKEYRAKLAVWLSHSTFTGDRNVGHLVSNLPSAPSSLPLVPSLVRILDIDNNTCWLEQGRKPYAPQDPTLAALTSLRTLRRLAGAAVTREVCYCVRDEWEWDVCDCLLSHFELPPAHTVVDFLEPDCPPNPGVERHLCLRADTDRHIIHVGWGEDDDAGPESLPARHYLWSEKIDTSHFEVVIVLRPPSPGNRAATDRHALLVRNIVDELVGKWSAGHLRFALTIVGIEALDLASPASDPDARRSEFAHLAHRRLSERAEHDITWCLRVLNERATFLALDEWRASLGDEVAVLGYWP